MSKAPKNIEKILLAAGVLVGGGLAALGYLKLGKVDEDYPSVAGGRNGGDPSVAGAERIPGTINSLTSNRDLTPGMSGQRPVNLFVGVPLFSQRENPNEPVDLRISPDVHAQIPNEWWLENDVSPNFADSPQRDKDEDGFSNLEEFLAKTDPSDADVYPEAATKLAYRKDKSVAWLMEFGFEAGGKWLPKIENLDTGEKNRVDFDKGVEPDQLFFSDEPFKERFKMLRIEERTERNERLNVDQTLRYGIYEDQAPNKKGRLYEVPNRIPRAERDKWTQYDRTAVLELKALGEQGKEFEVEEGTRFSLPAGGEEKKYLLKSVTPDQIEVEWEADGETKTLVIPKG